MTKHFRLGLVLAVLLLLVQSLSAQDFGELARRVPINANTLILVNAEKILSTPIAKKLDWKAKLADAHAAGMTILPPGTDQAVFASQMDLGSMTPLWETVVMRVDEEPNLEMFAKKMGGAFDNINGNNVVHLKGDAAVVQFGPKIVAARSASPRQAVGRWIRETESHADFVSSEYLKEAFNFADQFGTPIILAMDGQDAVTERTVSARLLESELYSKASDDQIDKLSKWLASIRGVMLGVTINEKIFGKIRVDFGTPVPIKPDAAKALLLHVLGERGLMLEELNDWKPGVSDKTVTLEGNLTPRSLRFIFSLFSAPPSIKVTKEEMEVMEPTTPPAPQTEEEKTQVIIDSTKQYVDRIDKYFGDIRHKKYERGTTTTGSWAKWYDSYARKIDQLPTLHVDPYAIQFGADTASGLRDASSALRVVGGQSRVKEQQVRSYNSYSHTDTYGYVANYGGIFGGASGVTPLQNTQSATIRDQRQESADRAAVRTQERVKGYESANSIIQKLEAMQGDIRRQLTTKYNVQF